MTLLSNDPLAISTVDAIQRGSVDELRRLLAANTGLVTQRIVAPDGCERSLLHIATDWPGHFPNVDAIIAALIAAGADVDAAFVGPHTETALHWAASSNDLVALDALLTGGATIDAPGAIIGGGGTALDDAVAFGQWEAARRLVEWGAQTTFGTAAALGLLDRVEASFNREVLSSDVVTNAFWYACHGGQRVTAEYLADRGADIDWIGYDELTPLDVARRSGATAVVNWLEDRGASSADQLRIKAGAD